MAPQNAAGKRVKGVQLYRPFIYGTTARPFDEVHNPKPPGVPDDHTHSWEVFVKGIEDTDVTYWLRRVQFKLHESIPNHVRMVEGEAGKPFVVRDTGWGEFEISLKLYYAPEANEKPQTLYHHLRLHPYGRTEAEKEAMRAGTNANGTGSGVPGEVVAWVYEEQLFNEPYDKFYDVLTKGAPPPPGKIGGGKGKGGKGGVGTPTSATAAGAQLLQGERSPGGVLERSAMVPLGSRPGHPFSRETEQLEVRRLKEAGDRVDEMTRAMARQLAEKEAELKALRDENRAAQAGG